MGNDKPSELSPARKKRVQRLKKLIVTCILILIFLPLALCIYFGTLAYSLNNELSETKEELNYYLELASENTFWETVEEPLTETEEESEELPITVNEPTVINLDGDSFSLSDDELYAGFKKVYLTFDDGPSPNTEPILDILKQYEVPATFFVVKREGRTYEKLYRRIVEEGHSLGMHSCTHVYKDIYASKEAFSEDVDSLRKFLYLVTGVESDIYRFPGGSSNHVSSTDINLLSDVLAKEGIEYYDWNISSGDASATGTTKEAIVRNVTGKVSQHDESIILFHDLDTKGATVEALPEIIQYIKSMENTVILPITKETNPIHHLSEHK